MPATPLAKDRLSLPSVSSLLTMGGDRRILCDPVTGANKYHCPPVPDASLLAFGSVTASTISAHAFAAAESLHQRLAARAALEAPEESYGDELQRIRRELRQLLGLGRTDILFAASGTDLHLLAAQLASQTKAPPLILIMEASETGSGVPPALAGKHFSDTTVSGIHVTAGTIIEGFITPEIRTIASRNDNGSLRPEADIDNEFAACAARAAAAGRPVLLVLTDVSKTGLIVPSPACVLELRKRFPQVEILVDACQLRLSPATLRTYLDQGFMVAVTGSKFISGPAFCGALLVPASKAQALRSHVLPPSLGAYSMRADWPEGWAARESCPDHANFGLLLRWQAALAEMQRFYALPEHSVSHFVTHFAAIIEARIAGDPAFEGLAVSALDRDPICHFRDWNSTQTIFPFLLRRPQGQWLSRDETEAVYKRLRRECHIELGQPVLCGVRDGIPVAALRLAVSARLIADALLPGGCGEEAVIHDALLVLDKAARFTSS